jgi:uncharacterized protein YkuJ
MGALLLFLLACGAAAQDKPGKDTFRMVTQKDAAKETVTYHFESNRLTMASVKVVYSDEAEARFSYEMKQKDDIFRNLKKKGNVVTYDTLPVTAGMEKDDLMQRLGALNPSADIME